MERDIVCIPGLSHAQRPQSYQLNAFSSHPFLGLVFMSLATQSILAQSGSWRWTDPIVSAWPALRRGSHSFWIGEKQCPSWKWVSHSLLSFLPHSGLIALQTALLGTWECLIGDKNLWKDRPFGKTGGCRELSYPQAKTVTSWPTTSGYHQITFQFMLTHSCLAQRWVLFLYQ
jgi:hypothetical protein